MPQSQPAVSLPTRRRNLLPGVLSVLAGVLCVGLLTVGLRFHGDPYSVPKVSVGQHFYVEQNGIGGSVGVLAIRPVVVTNTAGADFVAVYCKFISPLPPRGGDGKSRCASTTALRPGGPSLDVGVGIGIGVIVIVITPHHVGRVDIQGSVLTTSWDASSPTHQVHLSGGAYLQCVN